MSPAEANLILALIVLVLWLGIGVKLWQRRKITPPRYVVLYVGALAMALLGVDTALPRVFQIDLGNMVVLAHIFRAVTIITLLGYMIYAIRDLPNGEE